jgi:protease YdgD
MLRGARRARLEARRAAGQGFSSLVVCSARGLTVIIGALLSVAFAAAAAMPPGLPGIGPVDHRVRVEPVAPPWDAVVKVQTNIGGRCTGALVASDIVLTAAHCLYNPHTLALLQPVSLHVLIGFESGYYRWHALVRGYATGGGFIGGRRDRTPTADWARLDLAGAVPPAVTPLPVAASPPAAGDAVALAGYNQDEPLLLLADPSCRITATVDAPGARLLAHDCSATRGTSGGPLLEKSVGGGWRIVGINIAVSDRDSVALWAAGFARPR